MKMVRVLLVSIVLLVGQMLYAQEIAPVHAGLLAGGTFSFPGSESQDAQTENTEKFGYLAGAFLRIKLGSYYLQPELYYNSSRFELTINPNPPLFGPTPASTSLSGRINTLDLPLILGRYFLSSEILKIRINAGPVASYRVQDFFEKPKSPSDFDFNQNAQSLIWSLAVGAGVDISRFTIDARYHYQFGRPISTDQLKVRYDMLTLTLGYKIF